MITIDPNVLYELITNSTQYIPHLMKIENSSFNFYDFLASILIGLLIFILVCGFFLSACSNDEKDQENFRIWLGVICLVALIPVVSLKMESRENKLFKMEEILSTKKLDKKLDKKFIATGTYFYSKDLSDEFKKNYITVYKQYKPLLNEIQKLTEYSYFDYHKDNMIVENHNQINVEERIEQNKTLNKNITNILKNVLTEKESQKLENELNQCYDFQSINQQQVIFTTKGVVHCVNNKIVDSLKDKR